MPTLKHQQRWLEWTCFLRNARVFEVMTFTPGDEHIYASPSNTLEYVEVGIATVSDY